MLTSTGTGIATLDGHRTHRRENRRKRWTKAAVTLLTTTITLALSVGPQEATADTRIPHAASDLDPMHVTSDAKTTFRYPWYVVNATDKTLDWGQFCKVEVGNLSPLTHSILEFGGSTPWAPLKPGERTADAFLTSIVTATNFSSGILSINGRLWAPSVGFHTRFHQTSGVSWDRMWIFWDEETGTPFLTAEGGYDDITLEPVDSPYGNFNACSLL